MRRFPLSLALGLAALAGACATAGRDGAAVQVASPPAGEAAPEPSPQLAPQPGAAPPGAEEPAGAAATATVDPATAATSAAPAAEPVAEDVEPAPPFGVTQTVDLTPPPTASELRQRRGVSPPCVEPVPTGEAKLDATRRRLYETLCSAALWFDGLFGEHGDVRAARQVWGRVELAGLDSQYYGTKLRSRVNVRVRLPTLEDRLEAFVGRDEDDVFVADRNEGFALRSQFPQLERDDQWVAGLGYGLPGSYRQRSDVRLGGKLGTRPALFLQARHRRNWYVGDRSLWHFRETLFWSTREGFGTTTSLDFDRVLTPNLLFRWGNIGTFSQDTDGLNWRVVLVLYQNLRRGRAIAYEAFARGETDEDVQVSEYGLRGIFRRPIGGRDWLFGEFIFGYGWPREELYETRRGSYLVGFGAELRFGRH